MEYTIENQFLKVTVSTAGAQVVHVVDKADGVEHMWQGDPTVWKGRAPILFPHTGHVVGDTILVKGKEYPAKSHGFARDLEHKFVRQTEDTVVLELTQCPETLERWPFRFRLESTFRLEGRTLHHTLKVYNDDDAEMSFGIGFHPAFRIPFDDAHTYEDYEYRFDKLESPVCLTIGAGGLVENTTYSIGNNIRKIQIDDKLFANDSHTMTALQSDTLGVYEKNSNRSVVCKISGFPYVLIWSKPGEPKFVCIEPWHTTPSHADGSRVWEEKPAAALLQPGEEWETTLSTTFN